jgi:hypothetical protein
MVAKSITLTVLLLFAASLIYPLTRPVEPTETSFSGKMDQLLSAYQLLNDTSLNREAFLLAMQGYELLKAKGVLIRDQLITIIDYSRPSSMERFYVIDLCTKTILYKTLVAHGRNSGDLYARCFSNKAQSHQSALGFFVTGKTYNGSQGYSLQMNGVDTGFNENALKRSIVIHGADYATARYIKLYGRLGRSFGCPALPPEIVAPVINLIKEGSLIFSYFPDKTYLSASRVVARMPKEPEMSAGL